MCLVRLVMQHFHHKKTLRNHLSEIRSDAESIGFVPTMGALHSGHLSLVETAFRENNIVVVSIFVNPTQFDNSEDLEKYPRNLEEDLGKLRGVSDEIIVFIPSANDIYDNAISAAVFDFDGLESEMEGKYREDHFNGVATIVKKLFEAVQPDKAYFGEKDYQQLLIVKKLVSKYKLPIQITGCPIAREANGLAMSSRNERLPLITREKAAVIYSTLLEAREKFKTEAPSDIKKQITNQFKNHELFSLEYIEIADAETLKPATKKETGKKYRIFIAVYANVVRLIDNIALN